MGSGMKDGVWRKCEHRGNNQQKRLLEGQVEATDIEYYLIYTSVKEIKSHKVIEETLTTSRHNFSPSETFNARNGFQVTMVTYGNHQTT